jgi:hypothetical protein
VVWIAEGPVCSRSGGYCFRAVERDIFHPPMEIHYPIGRPVTISPANVFISPTPKPEWLVEIDEIGPTARHEAIERTVVETTTGYEKR